MKDLEKNVTAKVKAECDAVLESAQQVFFFFLLFSFFVLHTHKYTHILSVNVVLESTQQCFSFFLFFLLLYMFVRTHNECGAALESNEPVFFWCVLFPYICLQILSVT